MTFNLDFSGDKPRDPEELETALARIEAHKAFDWLWKKTPWSRSRAYAWLSDELRIAPKNTHIKQFDAETCRRVIELVRLKRLTLQGICE